MSDVNLVKFTKKLLPPNDGKNLTPSELHDAIVTIMKLLKGLGTTGAGGVPDDVEQLPLLVKIASFLTALRTSGLDHKAAYIAEAAKAVLAFSRLVDLPMVSQTNGKINILDIVGTGGDGQNTFNVSTSAAIVASGIPHLKICKHGGKASTSNSGAGDLIGKLGCDIAKVTPQTVPQLWNDNDFLFLLAPYFHDGMSLMAPLRKLLGIPTIFNVLGPLLHPVDHVNKRVLGVYSHDLGEEYVKAAAMVYPESEIFVVWGNIGLDEVSPIGKTTVWHFKKDIEYQQNVFQKFDIDSSMFGLQEHQLTDCLSLGPAENARILRDEILSGKYKLGDNHPIYDYILMNTAVLYCLAVGNHDWKTGVEMAEASIQSGAALQSLQCFIDSVQKL
ncbi:similar to Saccharomyces cerevisiae YDR354W TRP4 Anthranilate phosphoribosyl transferase of the tryptophan biosynthetic pathway [Maudiozyma barnettii]|uniref:Similar to Saccharomyces cerevisiae YDR354W TRP4 Anthranilate phosphoribosyl transferase of the tryptophan biosynthetic pathway n=1 Tax=Maudiozyma barnettii TaxID=61262 RepID=A0A8H2VEQ7_9SACH|nr:anthranilate phosphoribosyltransferase [Kazachstania barnettii]CAB4253769.1 similar to Saccharomyces cerevisiae YDR354W TRP4 Anthranilate phosphoribosyl transferase of the tryptophan biosynthetic pathway [Kazachstania barnettii]CAD1781518.1 similar to Saccharomyces cerevisiae YDR354W TRP4 Anthranilate phosphoribosyl transferase of the tryptophan biosynthetic pathway [Kazachstania barnettii]